MHTSPLPPYQVFFCVCHVVKTAKPAQHPPPDHHWRRGATSPLQEPGTGSGKKGAAAATGGLADDPAVANHPVMVQQLEQGPTPGDRHFALQPAPDAIQDSPVGGGGGGSGDTVAMDITGDATGALLQPSDLMVQGGALEVDSTTWQLQQFQAQQQQQQTALGGDDAAAPVEITMDVTAGVPRIGSLLDEDELDTGAA